MFVQAVRFVDARATNNGNGKDKAPGSVRNVAIFGQEMNYTTYCLAKMNMALRAIDAKIEWNEKGSFLQNAFKDKRFNFIMANPPFNGEDWGFSKVKKDVRWDKFGDPPAGGKRKQKDGTIIKVDGGNAPG